MLKIIGALFALAVFALPVNAQDAVSCDFSAADSAWVRQGYGENVDDVPSERLRDPEAWVIAQPFVVNRDALNYFYREMQPLYLVTYLRDNGDGRQEIVGFIEARVLGDMVWLTMQDLAGRESSANPNVTYDWHFCAVGMLAADDPALAWLEGLAYGN